MNEFEGKSKAQLEEMKFAIESYIQGHKDFFEDIRINYLERTAHFKQKLAVCEAEIDKVTNESNR